MGSSDIGLKERGREGEGGREREKEREGERRERERERTDGTERDGGCSDGTRTRHELKIVVIEIWDRNCSNETHKICFFFVCVCVCLCLSLSVCVCMSLSVSVCASYS